MAKGGFRAGAGRKPKVDEERVQNLAVSAIVAKYGSEEKGFTALLESGEASLIKFVYEHAFGKPTDNVNNNHSGMINLILTPSDGCEPINYERKDS